MNTAIFRGRFLGLSRVGADNQGENAISSDCRATAAPLEIVTAVWRRAVLLHGLGSDMPLPAGHPLWVRPAAIMRRMIRWMLART
jgi:hypothetical protein